MIYRWLAEVVVVVHFAFVVYVALGGFLTWRWPRTFVLHAASVVYALGIVVIGWDCPLTTLENHFRRVGGEADYQQGFVDRYLKDVIFPHQLTSSLRVLVAVLVVVSWIGLQRRHRNRRAAVGRTALQP
jgi:hypothetical protein